ncbi:uncharacterized protein LOC18440312 isoform X1 [Amborella trichopoda]|uniref:F-box/LRR-repeat protein 15-like leucin rich repeat domain-containing protein n=2 Tax=Amborella trichopoda TaxID=13333 RepID=W1PWF1_AMBTC|nr:uncharacterized protein LOC18440312 isoform X1 [Amborella trichopoda]XP_020526665.1 uncharacterized protein LOC18440312 isoform X1 [Amborella trichopoda]ERN12106.1 hypothetical protein AMTR_s00159p00019280 [Amborella trichopoda]|eukprot:XP_006850525.1 uncharacterized protein LOC18440312 isoform X1 [Amborella trichopoda]
MSKKIYMSMGRKALIKRDLESIMAYNEGEGLLTVMCVDAACKNPQAIEIWRRQRRTLESMPSQLAGGLLRLLIQRHLITPSLLEVFKTCIEEVDLMGESSVDAEWMAYLGAYRYLRSLNLADCKRVTDFALWNISGLSSLQEVDLSRCSRITDKGIAHLLSIQNLQKLCLPETAVSSNGVHLLSSLRNLTYLDLGGIRVTDSALSSLATLTDLEYLELWGSDISDQGAAFLTRLSKLNFLNLAWTNVTELPNFPSLKTLNMSQCAISSIFHGENETRPLLYKLLVSGAIFKDVHRAFSCLETANLSYLDISGSIMDEFHFLSSMKALEYLDISSTKMGDSSIDSLICIGENLRVLKLRNTKITSNWVAALAGNVPNLEAISLSHTAVDDDVFSYIKLMPALRGIDLSNTNIKGFLQQHINGVLKTTPSLVALQDLKNLERLDLEDTQVRDSALHPLSRLSELIHLSLKNDFLSDITLHPMSSIPKLKFLGIRGAVLTSAGLCSFKPPGMLETLDLRGCWLLTNEGVSQFCRSYPWIHVKHEFVKMSSTDSNSSSDCLLPWHGTSGTCRPRNIRRKTPSSMLNTRKKFVDERIKYSRSELLNLQPSHLSRITLS